MTTVDVNTPIRKIIAARLLSGTRARSRRHLNVSSGRFGLIITMATRFLMHVAGFGCLTIAAFTWTVAAGFVAAGLSLFLLSWLTTSKPTNTSTE